MKHRPEAEGYQKSEIVYEDYDEQECRRILDYLLHTYFDPYKQDAIGCAHYLVISVLRVISSARLLMLFICRAHSI